MVEEQKESFEEEVEKIKRKISPDYLAIARVPLKTREFFFNFSKEEFCGDRGMCLKFLCDFYTGILDKGIEHLELAITDINERLTKLEEQSKPVNIEEEKPKRTRLDGSPIR